MLRATTPSSLLIETGEPLKAIQMAQALREGMEAYLAVR
jgi:hypothetical protein